MTPDGKYLFFNRKVGEFDWTHPDGKVETISDTDVYWVDASVIQDLRPESHIAPEASKADKAISFWDIDELQSPFSILHQQAQ